MEICAVVLAAEAGEKMKSKHSKVVHKVAGKPMVLWVAEALESVGAKEQAYVVGYRQEEVRQVLGEDVAFVLEEQPMGSGHAVMQATPFLEGRNGCTIILSGDMPLISSKTLKKALDVFVNQDYDALILTAETTQPKGYHRIIRNDKGEFQRVLIASEVDDKTAFITEISPGIGFVKTPLLLSALGKVAAKKQQKDFALTEALAVLIQEEREVGTFEVDFEEVVPVHNRIDLHQAEKIINQRICRRLMENGAQIIDPYSTWIDVDVEIGQDTIIRPFTTIRGKTVIGEDCIIGPSTHLDEVIVGDGTTLVRSEASKCWIGSNCRIGPFTHIRQDAVLKDNVTIGAYVEIKNSTIGDYSRAIQHAYIGDTQIGKNVNIGCGVITCNYDGLDKTACQVGDNVFVGANVNLISPVHLRDNSYIAAGTTITDDVPELAMAIGRARQTNKEMWVVKNNRVRNSKLMPSEREWL